MRKPIPVSSFRKRVVAGVLEQGLNLNVLILELLDLNQCVFVNLWARNSFKALGDGIFIGLLTGESIDEKYQKCIHDQHTNHKNKDEIFF